MLCYYLYQSSLCPSKYHVTFKVTIESKSNNDHLKFNGNFKNHMTFWRTQRGLPPCSITPTCLLMDDVFVKMALKDLCKSVCENTNNYDILRF
jgi:hypothetical protein